MRESKDPASGQAMRWVIPASTARRRILIGCLLALVATLLAREARGLLIGKRAASATIERIRSLAAAHPEVGRVSHVHTVHTAPENVFVAISADFDAALPIGVAERLVERIETELRDTVPALSPI